MPGNANLGLTKRASAGSLIHHRRRGRVGGKLPELKDTLWSMEDIAALVEASAPKPGKRGPYKKRMPEISN
jgi:hypothetical protein